MLGKLMDSNELGYQNGPNSIVQCKIHQPLSALDRMEKEDQK